MSPKAARNSATKKPSEEGRVSTESAFEIFTGGPTIDVIVAVEGNQTTIDDQPNLMRIPPDLMQALYAPPVVPIPTSKEGIRDYLSSLLDNMEQPGEWHVGPEDEHSDVWDPATRKWKKDGAAAMFTILRNTEPYPDAASVSEHNDRIRLQVSVRLNTVDSSE